MVKQLKGIKNIHNIKRLSAFRPYTHKQEETGDHSSSRQQKMTRLPGSQHKISGLYDSKTNTFFFVGLAEWEAIKKTSKEKESL